MNKVCLIGRLTRDPELRYTSSNRAVASFTLAVNRQFTNQSGEREADFIPIVVWGKQAENVKNYINQGSQVAVEGRIQTRSYDDQNGQRRYVTEVVAEAVHFIESRASREQRGNAPAQNNYSQNNYQSAPVTNEATPYDFCNNQTTNVVDDPFKDFGDEIKIGDNELPF